MQNKRRRIALLVATFIAAFGFLTAAEPLFATATEQVLYSFEGGGAGDGSNPAAPLIFDAAGNLYGTTLGGGDGGCRNDYGCGTVFELTPVAGGGWTETVLYSFQGGKDGEEPFSGLIFDAAGNLYGTTGEGGGGCAESGCGTVFELTPVAGGGWTETVIYSFRGGKDGEGPSSGLIFDAAGNLYGTTGEGGGGGCDGGYGCGTVFELMPVSGGGWTESVLYSFTGGKNGQQPAGGLIFDAAGNLYGMTQQGGGKGCNNNPCGVVFELTPVSGGKWKQKLLHSFTRKTKDGFEPLGGLIFDAVGNLYGMTQYGGGTTCYGGGCGVVFELTPIAHGKWTETILYAFQRVPDGACPRGSLIFDPLGNLYGTTAYGGTKGGSGTAFELTPNQGGGWTETVLYIFGGKYGRDPLSGLIFDGAGNLYGTALMGGESPAFGVVFEITP